MPKDLLRYFLIPWVALLVGAPFLAAFFNYDADTIWDVDKISTKLLVIILLICLTFKDKAFYILLVVVSLITLNQIVDILTIDMKAILHLVGYNE